MNLASHYLLPAVILAFGILPPAVSMGESIALLSAQIEESGECPDSLPQRPAKRWTRLIGIEETLFQNTSPTARPVRPNPKLFDDKLHIEVESAEQSRILVRWNSSKNRDRPSYRCGFADRADLLPVRDKNGKELRKPTPLKADDAYDEADATRLRDFENKLDLKVIIQNLHVEGAEPPALLDRPSGKMLRRPRLYEVYHVYKTHFGDKNVHYLVGKPSREPKLFGWLSAKHSYVWNSRMAVFWAGTGRARGYTNPSFAGEPVREPAEFVSELPAPPSKKGSRKKGKKGKRIVPRFPLLKQYPEAEILMEKLTERASPDVYLKNIEHLVVVVPGSIKPGSAPLAASIDTPNEIAAARQRVAEVLNNLGMIDIIFLIDATKSMLKYFQPVADAVRGFVDDHADDIEQSIQVGVVIYGDYDETGRRIDIGTLVPLHKPASQGDDLMAGLNMRGKPPLGDPHIDPLEAPLAAVVNVAQWRELAFRLRDSDDCPYRRSRK